ncbi:MAG: class I SAM-dependent methyltransferase [Candidatus Saccharibacteria bacterium]
MNTTNEETIEAYNQAVDKYIKGSPQFVSDELKVWIDSNLSQLSKNAKILEIGSGSGKDADYFASQGYTMELTDASEGFVEHLKHKGYTARKFNVLLDDINSDYDMVFADAVFLHFTKEELVAVLNKTFQAVKSGGRLAFTVKVGNGEESTARKLDYPRYFNYWQEAEIEVMLKASGFSEIYIKSGNDFRGEQKPDWLYINAIR